MLYGTVEPKSKPAVNTPLSFDDLFPADSGAGFPAKSASQTPAEEELREEPPEVFEITEENLKK